MYYYLVVFYIIALIVSFKFTLLCSILVIIISGAQLLKFNGIIIITIKTTTYKGI